MSLISVCNNNNLYNLYIFSMLSAKKRLQLSNRDTELRIKPEILLRQSVSAEKAFNLICFSISFIKNILEHVIYNYLK